MSDPREELGRRLGRAIANNRRDIGKQAEESGVILDEFAIGVWVSVDERLPKFDDEGYWPGIYKGKDEKEADISESIHERSFKVAVEDGYIAHWLDLSLPEVERVES